MVCSTLMHSPVNDVWSTNMPAPRVGSHSRVRCRSCGEREEEVESQAIYVQGKGKRTRAAEEIKVMQA